MSLIIILLSLWSGLTNYSSYTTILTKIGQFQLTNNTPLLMFVNSLIFDCIVIVAGFSFSILSVLLTVVNGVNIGYIFATQNLLQNSNFNLICVVFELISYVFALVGAFLVTKIEIRLISRLINRKFDEIFSKIKVQLKDVILTMVLIVILLLIELFVGLIL